MIYIASDHAGFEVKKALVEHLQTQGLEVEDIGPQVYDKDDDYPDFIYPCAQKVAQGGSETRGIVIGWSGNGEAIVANKVKGIRAAVYYGGDLEMVKLSREHNNANVLSLSAHFLSAEQAKQAVDLWLATPFAGGRHERRISKIAHLEEQSFK